MIIFKLSIQQINPLIAFTIGYTSHIIIDCASVQGVKILYPLSNKNGVFPFDTTQPQAYRITVGSKADIALGFIFLFLTLPLGFISYKTHTRFIREIQKDINSAVKDFNELSSNYLCFAKLTGINTISNNKISGEFLVISSLDQNTLLARVNSLVLSIGKNYYKDDIFTNNIEIKPKIKAIDTTFKITITNQTLSSALQNLIDSLTYITGSIEFFEPINITPPSTKFKLISSSEKQINLNHAPLDFLIKENLSNLLIKRSTLTIKTFYIQTPTTQPTTQTSNPQQKIIAQEIEYLQNQS
ncbi:MAG: metal-dependent hydrolase, partial [Candidatus Kryptonium sp.]